MSGAREVASEAVEYIETLIADMLAGNYPDNEVSLGRVKCGSSTIQIQLRVTQDRDAFLDSDESDEEVA